MPGDLWIDEASNSWSLTAMWDTQTRSTGTTTIVMGLNGWEVTHYPHLVDGIPAENQEHLLAENYLEWLEKQPDMKREDIAEEPHV